MFLKAGADGISTSTSVSHWNLLLLPLSYGSDIDSKFEWDTDIEVEFSAAPALLSMDARVPSTRRTQVGDRGISNHQRMCVDAIYFLKSTFFPCNSHIGHVAARRTNVDDYYWDYFEPES